MKITDVKVLPIDRYLFVEVHTDEGITGLGESDAWGYLEASGEVVKSFRAYLIGKDPCVSNITGRSCTGVRTSAAWNSWSITAIHSWSSCFHIRL